mmetsp:Transcript_8914/g.16166  ORF Transcript_8914/g.16166 Transcript_8914/m.16166 type:complete len:204 (+) Transcript_8914:146-757(+)|eukprot:CAMPEP_0182497134 /NCGR_PEP_ID=MMETSP1321-20130603/5677_1 /TAXON_ID=91990 /ORGANISM="Bolidomonas sp., Strain RCC1657" /LENGTH=203 /DNA_ID=CAMNT_0024700929 /DNA_START=96 /DNA_END=707 /DNA_ORIENTATION=-
MLKKNKMTRIASALLRVALSAFALTDMLAANAGYAAYIDKPTNDDSYEQIQIQQCFDNNPKIECVDYVYDEAVQLCATETISQSLYWVGLVFIVIESLVALATAFLSSNTGEATPRYLIADGVLDIIIMIIASAIANQLSAAATLNKEFYDCYPNHDSDDQFWKRVALEATDSEVSSAYTIAVVVAITQAQEFVDKVAEFISD